MNILKLFMPQPNVVRADHNNFAFFISSLGTFPPLKLFFSYDFVCTITCSHGELFRHSFHLNAFWCTCGDLMMQYAQA